MLLTAGMSTPTLREMDRAGISIEGAGGAEVALPFLFLAVFHFLSLLQLVLDITFLRCVWQYWLWPGIPVAIRSVVILMIWWSPSDERCFAFKMIAKVVSGYILISCPLLVYWEWNHDDVTEEAAYTWSLGDIREEPPPPPPPPPQPPPRPPPPPNIEPPTPSTHEPFM